MCDTYVDGVGYVCYECESEFKEYLERNHLDPTNENEIKGHLAVFMTTPKGAYTIGEDITIDDFFKKYSNNES